MHLPALNLHNQTERRRLSAFSHYTRCTCTIALCQVQGRCNNIIMNGNLHSEMCIVHIDAENRSCVQFKFKSDATSAECAFSNYRDCSWLNVSLREAAQVYRNAADAAVEAAWATDMYESGIRSCTKTRSGKLGDATVALKIFLALVHVSMRCLESQEAWLVRIFEFGSVLWAQLLLRMPRDW